MEIRIGDHKLDEAYLRHARLETLKTVQVDAEPSMVNILPFAKYVVAYDQHDKPIGMCESAMLSDVYDSYEAAPYSHVCDLSAYGPLHQFMGVRTIYLEPEYRRNNMAFLSLIFGSAQLFRGLGARFATASTRAGDEYLNRLYEKCGGERVGAFQMDNVSEPSSLFIFDLEKAINHRVVQRITRYVTVNLGAELVAE